VAKRRKGLESLDDEIRDLGGQATLVPLDLQKMDGLDELGLAIYERWKKLDILVGNAGILGPLSPISHIKPHDWQKVMYRLIRSMDALLRSSEAGRALFISSGITKTARAYWGAYAASKAGLESIVGTYAQETLKTNVRANLLNPGAMRTLMRAEAYPGEAKEDQTNPEELAPAILKLLSSEFDQTGQMFDVADLKKI
jgi:NAD(P)-dependent dehydrogenase (short-subunit alcohol dehydrogenase family)